MWKKVIGLPPKVGVQYIHEFKLMRKDDDEEEFIYVPEEIPESVPIPVPVKEPAKEPQKVGQVVDLTDDENSKPQVRRGKIIGYRCMNASKVDGKWMFHSPQSPGMKWGRGAVTAGTERCGGNHVAPDKDCDCGLYSTSSEEKLKAAYGDPKQEWTVQVEGWGKVHTSKMNSTVIRTEHMQIVGLRPPKCEQCDNPASHMISANPNVIGGRTSCEDHIPTSTGKLQIHRLPIEDVTKELSNYYGGAKVISHGEDWDEEEEEDLKAYGSTDGWSRVGFTIPKVSASPFRKEFKQVRDHAEGLGWTVEQTSKGWMFKAPEGAIQSGRKGLVVTHGSPSDHRAFKNFLSDLKNEGGLVWPPEKARQREKKRDKDHDPEDCLTSKGFDTSGLGGDDLIEFHQMSHEDERGVA